jgi:hypothetical protein
MKYTTPLACLAAVVAVLGTSNAFADDPHLRTLIANQRAQMEREKETTVAIYARERGVGRYERVKTVRYRGSEERPLVLHRGRGETQVIERR